MRDTIARVESGETIGVAWVERCGDFYRTQWCGTDAPGNWSREGRIYVGHNLLRAGVCYLGTRMDAAKLDLAQNGD